MKRKPETITVNGMTLTKTICQMIQKEKEKNYFKISWQVSKWNIKLSIKRDET
jgi:hypothetical protein